MKISHHFLLGCGLACLLLTACQTPESPSFRPERPQFVEGRNGLDMLDEEAMIALARVTFQDDPHVFLDSILTGEALEAHLLWAASLPPDSVLAIGGQDSISYPPMPGDTIHEADSSTALGVKIIITKPHCRYFVVGLQGIDCDGFRDREGGVLCVQCDRTFPQGTCPSWKDKQMNYYDANGNVTCTGKVTQDMGQACDECALPAKIVSKR
jgi:hypothetical protein